MPQSPIASEIPVFPTSFQNGKFYIAYITTVNEIGVAPQIPQVLTFNILQ